MQSKVYVLGPGRRIRGVAVETSVVKSVLGPLADYSKPLRVNEEDGLVLGFKPFRRDRSNEKTNLGVKGRELLERQVWRSG